MFELVECEDIVRIPPDKFGQPLEKIAKEQLKMKYEGMIDEELGYVIAIINVKIDPVGRILIGDGGTYHKTTFDLLTFLPGPQEIVEGEVVEVEDFGAFVRVGPVDCLLHISQIMDDLISYDERHASLIGTRTQKKLTKGDMVRVRVTSVSLTRGGISGKIGVTSRQPFLGKLEWIEESAKKIEEAKLLPRGARSERESL